MSDKDIVEEARELVKLHEANGCGCRVCTLLRALADEVEGLRMAVSHAIRRNHDYAPASCDGCADAERALTTKGETSHAKD